MGNLAVLALLLAPAQYEIRPAAGNRLALEVFKSGLWNGRKHSFTFERYHGTLSYDPAAPERSSVQLTIEAKSIALHDTWVSEKDRAKIVKFALSDMLQADQRPELTFSSTRVTVKTANEFEVEGYLTMRGVSKPVKVRAALKPDFTVEGGATLRMTKWGMKPPSAALGTIGTRDEMTFSFALKPAQTAR